MDKRTMQEFSARITQANRSELVVITYEIILEEISSAKAAYASGDTAGFTGDINRARRFLNELMGSLDYHYEIAGNLMALYRFADSRLALAAAEKKPEALEGVPDMMETLLVGFREVSRQDQSGPVMINTQKLFAGLTYGKGKLNETFVSINEAGRGFRA